MDDVSDNFCEEYDDNDRYFDFVYDFYEDFRRELQDQYSYILDEMRFSDFYELFIKHMDQSVVDDIIVSKYLKTHQCNIGSIDKQCRNHKRDHTYDGPDDQI